MLQSQVNHLLAHTVRDTIPELPGLGTFVDQPVFPFFLVDCIPAIEAAAGNIQLFLGLVHRHLGIFHNVDDLTLLFRALPY